jgi:2-keto-3-deoxy-L-fuconate dehydrogenase
MDTIMAFSRINPVTLITGAASGIGAASASLLSSRSDGGLILADVDEDALCKTADSLSQPPERVSTLAFDLADPDRWAHAAQFIQDQYGRIDWAVVSTSDAHASDGNTDLVAWPRAEPQLDAISLTLRAVAPLMRGSAQGGAIVVTASTAALTAESNGNGGATLPRLIAAAAAEAARDHIRVNAIAPGGMDAALWASLPWFQDLVLQHGSEPAALDAIAAMKTPLARLGASEDITRLILMLLADDASITGATLLVEGGYTI